MVFLVLLGGLFSVLGERDLKVLRLIVWLLFQVFRAALIHVESALADFGHAALHPVEFVLFRRRLLKHVHLGSPGRIRIEKLALDETAEATVNNVADVHTVQF